MGMIEKKKVLKKYLENIYRSAQNDDPAKRYVLSGVKADPFGAKTKNAKTFIQDFLNRFEAANGHRPALLGVDVYSGNYDTLSEKQKQSTVDALVDFYRKGGIITVSSHLRQPVSRKGINNGGRKDMLTQLEWEQILIKGHDYNKNFHEDLAIPIDLLTRLCKAEVPVLWRPFHEMTAAWMWWGAWQKNENDSFTVNTEAYKKMWQYTYEYMTDTLGLDNLLWVYSPTPRDNICDTTSGVDIQGINDGGVRFCMPDDRYIDFVGLDSYFDSSYKTYSDVISYDSMPNKDYGNAHQFERAYRSFMTLPSGMAVSLSECGYEVKWESDGKTDISQKSSDSLNSIINSMLDAQMGISYFMTWSGTSLQEMSDGGKCIMNNPRVLDLANSARMQGK